MPFHPKSATLLRGDCEWAQYAPHPALSAWISAYWTLETGAGRHVVRALPDACIDVTIRLSGAPGAFVSGAQTRARSYEHRGRVHLLGARMLPGAAALLGFDIDALDEGWTPLEAVLPPGLVARLVRDVSRASDVRARVALLDAFFSDRLLNREVDPRLSAALRAVFAARGEISMTALARAAGAHTRTLSRIFGEWVGLSPKRFARIVRFQAALRALPALPQKGRGAQVAVELGYSDQAHFIRDVRELFGATPREIVRLAGRTR